MKEKQKEEPPKNPCAAHPEAEACAPCPQCAKACCAACLVRHGPEKTVLCSKCMAALAEKLNKKVRQCELLSTACLLAAIAAVVGAVRRQAFDALGIALAAGAAAAGLAALFAYLAQRRTGAQLSVELFPPPPKH